MSDQANQKQPVAPALLAEECIGEINKACGCSAGWVIKTGDLLLRAERQLPRDQWLGMWQGGRLKFGLRTGEMLMHVARHPALRNAKHFSSLPAAWSILYVLSQLPPEVVQQGIADGTIHAEMKLVEARRLRSRSRAGGVTEPAAAQSQPFDVLRQTSRVVRSLRQQSGRWPAAHRAKLAQLLEIFATLLREGRIES
jgi:hypothetical protein